MKIAKNLYLPTKAQEQTCVHKTSHGADYFAAGKQFVTAAVHVTVCCAAQP